MRLKYFAGGVLKLKGEKKSHEETFKNRRTAGFLSRCSARRHKHPQENRKGADGVADGGVC